MLPSLRPAVSSSSTVSPHRAKAVRGQVAPGARPQRGEDVALDPGLGGYLLESGGQRLQRAAVGQQLRLAVLGLQGGLGLAAVLPVAGIAAALALRRSVREHGSAPVG